MACVHNCIIRGLNALFKHALTVQAADYAAFITLANIWHKFVMKHHDSEERTFFLPLQEKINPDAMKVSLNEHATFHDGMEEMQTYLTSLAGSESKYDGNEFTRILNSFSDALVTHLTHEIPALMTLDQYGDVDVIAKMWYSGVEAEVKTMKMGDFVTVVPFVLLAHDKKFEDGLHSNFPPMPAPILFMVRNVFSWPNRAAWKFMD